MENMLRYSKTLTQAEKLLQAFKSLNQFILEMCCKEQTLTIPIKSNSVNLTINSVSDTQLTYQLFKLFGKTETNYI